MNQRFVATGGLTLAAIIASALAPRLLPANAEVIATYGVEIEVVAAEITDGPYGPPVPVQVEVQGQSWWVDGDTRDALQLRSQAFPPQIEARVRHHHAAMGGPDVLVLEDGDVLVDVLDDHGVDPGRYGQADVRDVVDRFVDRRGVVRLDEGERLVLFEIGPGTKQMPAYDFNDLVIVVRKRYTSR